MIIKGGKTITPYGTYQNADIKVDGKKISRVEANTAIEEGKDIVLDVSGLYVSPGFIDIHSHGGIGYDLVSDNAEEILKAVQCCAGNGVTSIMPTMNGRPDPGEKDWKIYEAFNQAMEQNETGPQILGVHLEGPYFPASQTPNKVEVVPDLEKCEELIRKAPCVKRWTVAPEVEKGLEFIDLLVKHGIAVSVGHCEAPFEKIAEAYARGSRQVTHFYSGMKGVYRESNGDRKPGLVESSLILDFVIEVIANGRHMCPELLQMVYRFKGAKQICLVTDSHYWEPECAPAEGAHWSEFVRNADYGDGGVHLDSGMPYPVMLKIMVKEAGVPLIDAVRMATLTPAETMKIDDVKGKLLPGYDADIVAFDDDFNIKLVVARGEIIKNEL